MTRILITGMSGTGKSTVLDILAGRGYGTVETDEPGWCIPEDGDYSRHDREWIWDEPHIASLLKDHVDKHLFVSGCRPNQGRFYPQFDHIVVFRAPLDVMLQRVSQRSNNPFGHNPVERTAIIDDTEAVEPLLIRGADLVINTSSTHPEDIADRLEALL